MTSDEQNRALDCREAEALLLEADRADLRGEGDGPLAVHIRSCDACRRTAGRIVAGERALDDALEERAAARSVDEVLHAVRQELVTDREGGAGAAASIRWKVVVPLVAAALGALALWSSGPGDDSIPVSPVVRPAWSGSSSSSARGPTEPGEDEGGLRVEADGRFALMRTESPTISVVWFY